MIAFYLNDMTLPLVLAIDTSGPRLQLALAGAGMADQACQELARGHAEVIFDAIALLLKRNDFSYADVERLAVTTGPGSFTGLRIGLSAARGLALALEVPVIGVPTLMAMSLGSGAGPHAMLVDARRGEAYLQLFEAPGEPLGPAQLLPMEAARQSVPADFALVENATPDIAAMAGFARTADPAAWPADPDYLRQADAKPQLKGRIALAEAAR